MVDKCYSLVYIRYIAYLDKSMEEGKVEKIAALLFGACWLCPERECCETVGHSLACSFRNASKSQGALDLGGGHFANRQSGTKDMS